VSATMSMTRTGGCLCGAVRFSARPKTDGVDVCHCGMCRRWCGGPLMCLPCDDVAFEHETAVAAFASSAHGERLFCKTCGSSLLYRMKDGAGTWVALFALDDTAGLRLAEEIFIDDKPALYAFANDTRKLTGAEVMAAFGMQESAGG